MSSSPPSAYPAYQPPTPQSFDPNTPPAPPPKPSSQEVSRRSTPAGNQSLPSPPPPPPQETLGTYGAGGPEASQSSSQQALREVAYAQQIPDPGELWLPKVLEDKSSVTLPPLLPGSLGFPSTHNRSVGNKILLMS